MRWRPTGDNNGETEGIFLAELQSFLASELIYTGLYGACDTSALTQAGQQRQAIIDEQSGWFQLVSAYMKKALHVNNVVNDSFFS